ncbi:MAG: hypothetical protein KC492_22455 [Myxococcales bacterium]|nr:hypothetical protein [Myxococcales bacterium]
MAQHPERRRDTALLELFGRLISITERDQQISTQRTLCEKESDALVPRNSASSKDLQHQPYSRAVLAPVVPDVVT